MMLEIIPNNELAFGFRNEEISYKPGIISGFEGTQLKQQMDNN